MRAARPLTAVLLVLHLPACVTWRPSGIEPRRLFQEDRPTSADFVSWDWGSGG